MSSHSIHSDSADLSTDSLLADLDWLRDLAGTLARDPHLADDLVQDTCAIALRQTSAPQQSRAWLTTVLKNLLSAHRRRERVRQQREPRLEQDALGSAVLLLQRAEAQQELVAAVLRLDEPYRATVLLRFFDGLAPKRIAAQLGVPIATVQSRLQRAIKQLRQRLDVNLGGRSVWLVAFAPFARPSTTDSAVAGLVLMQTKAKILVAAAMIACTASFWWPTGRAAADAVAGPPTSERRAGRSDSGDDAMQIGPSGGAGNRRTRVDASRKPAHVVQDATRYTVSGRVCDCYGLALSGIHVTANGHEEHAVTSDAAGLFELETTAIAATLATIGGEYVTVLAGDWSKQSTIEPVVVVAPAVAVAGLTVASNAAPVAGSHVRLVLPADLESRFPVPLDRAGAERWEVVSDDTGRFHLPRLPSIEGAELMVTADAFLPVRVPLPPNGDANLQLVLHKFRYENGELMGRVVDPAGLPAKGARVAMGVTSVVTDNDGRFGLSLRRAGWPTAIVAAKQGYLPARFEVPKNGGANRESWGEDLVLRLGTSPQSVSGRVIDVNRIGIAGAEVWISDPTPLGIAGTMPMHIEYLIAGGAVPPQIAAMTARNADHPTEGDNIMNQASVPKPSAGWFYVTTDENGAFELPGLLDRAYSVKALDPATGLFGEAFAVTGGSYHEIQITGAEVWPEVRGRVVSLSGQPLAGVRIQQFVIAHSVQARVPGGKFEGTALREGRATTTAVDGTFVLRDVGHRFCRFSLSGDQIVPTRLDATAIENPSNCTIQVEARCHIEVALQDPSEADEIRCLDNIGEPMDVAVLRRNSNEFLTELPLHGGRSGLFVVGQGAATIVLLRGGQFVRRIAIVPDPDNTTTVN